VFAPNVRGSGGFGRTFVHADAKERRFAAIDDVADCVAYLVGNGFADATRIACGGWSYGGYPTMAALTFHPELFAAGISICGMSDLNTFYRNTEPWIAALADAGADWLTAAFANTR
jgi:dipeptidyl aminopeptidase/acylaminoacyl peptidase